MSLNVIVATTGRNTLENMLDSIVTQLDSDDYVTILADGTWSFSLVDKIVTRIKELYEPSCKIDVIYQEERLGYWGHGIRNAYQKNLPGDFLCNADDDDFYLPNKLYKAKQSLMPGELHLYRFVNRKNPVIVRYWHSTDCFVGNVGTPCGFYPNLRDELPEWGLFHGGDGKFYEKLAQKLKVRWKDELIYIAQ
jgi:hypothetical protein